MLLYEHDRTKDIVTRLVKSSKVLRTVIILYMIVIMAVLFGVFAYLVNDQLIIWAIIGFIGALFGLLMGFLVSSVFNIILEWMAQVLVAQGEILSQLRKKNKA
ncbi:MAG: hypothetical protein CVU40_18670 [Chloroflexi bacterium HGW-Chloroflexi-2]|jgi:uncharacterized membrane protein required for colicin V production|nr:MAG: hypothetical protein CVU40_18670 [Chloroflexi bacterium HGW-Chloroflexi-2]